MGFKFTGNILRESVGVLILSLLRKTHVESGEKDGTDRRNGKSCVSKVERCEVLLIGVSEKRADKV